MGYYGGGCALCGTFAYFALIRRWRDTFSTRGKAFFGCAWLHVIPLSKRDPACWRPAWGGVRLRGVGWWVRVIFGGWCRFAQDDTWVTGARYLICLVQMLAPSARPHPALRATFPLEGEGCYGGSLHEVVPFADFALIRRFAPPSPPGGRLLPVVQILLRSTSQ